MILRILAYICSLICLLFYMNAQANPSLSIYSHNTVNSTLRVDVYQERLDMVVAYINTHFDANITLSPSAMELSVSVRCESHWINVLTYICAQNNLEIVWQNDGILLRLQHFTKAVSSSDISPK